MKCLFSSDLHGEIYLYQELLNLTQSTSPEIVALGGDILPSFPPTRRYDDMIPNQKTFINQFLLPFFKRMIETTKVNHLFLIPGNWDVAYSHIFQKPVEGVIDLNQKIYRLNNGYEIVGYPFVPPTPFRPKDYERIDDRFSPFPPQKNPSYIRASGQNDELIAIDPHLYLNEKETIEEDLNQLPKPLHPKRSMYIMHSPPFRTRLDLIQGRHSAGSRSIRAFIEKDQPLLTLHGHIHESPQLSGSYVDRIGETLSVNPGQWVSKKLQAVTFEIEKIEKSLKHTDLPDILKDINL